MQPKQNDWTAYVHTTNPRQQMEWKTFNKVPGVWGSCESEELKSQY